MNTILDRCPDALLEQSIPGFHQYILTPPARLAYVSGNLCRLLQVSREQLMTGGYDQRVHPKDREEYLSSLGRITEPGTRILTYRLVKGDGTVCHVEDTLTCRLLEDGTLVADSVLCDITRVQEQTTDLRFLNDTIPCGFLKYTCEPQPRVTFLNDRMRQILRLPTDPSAGPSLERMYRDNLYLLIPPGERQRMAKYLDRVYRRGKPIAGEISVLRCDGTKARLFGWVVKSTDPRGGEEFQSVCIDMTGRYQERQAAQTQRYLKALTDVYDHIFEYELTGGAAKCLYAGDHPTLRWIENLSMPFEELTERWLEETVCPEDLDRVRETLGQFFRRFGQGQDADARPLELSFRARDTDAQELYSCLLLNMEASTFWLCCRRISAQAEVDQLRSENTNLKENLQELVTRFTDGLAAFEVRGGLVTPLYVSDNVCQFFGFTKEEWLPMMRRATPLRSFVARSEASYGDFLELLEDGEREFSYFDLSTRQERRIKAICSRKSPDSSSVFYVMLYNMAPEETPPPAADHPPVTIRTFGYFDVFVGQKPIAFRNKKSKELLALLVDRQGGFVTSEEAIAFLWEDEPASPVTLARYRKVALRLKNILEEYGISDILESVDGKRRIDPERIHCDLYDYLTGKPEYAQLFKGSYLTNYSWGETTLAALTGDFLT